MMSLIFIIILPASLWFTAMLAQEVFKMLLCLFSLLHIKTSWQPSSPVIPHLSPLLPKCCPAEVCNNDADNGFQFQFTSLTYQMHSLPSISFFFLHSIKIKHINMKLSRTSAEGNHKWIQLCFLSAFGGEFQLLFIMLQSKLYLLY